MKTKLICATYCTGLNQCGGISYDSPRCRIITSDDGGLPIPAKNFDKIHLINYSNLVRNDKLPYLLLGLKWPFTSTSHILINVRIDSFEGDPNIYLNKNGILPEPTRNEIGMGIKVDHCYDFNVHSGVFAANYYNCSAGLDVKGAGVKIAFHFPNAGEYEITTNHIARRGRYTNDLDFDSLIIGSKFDVSTVEIKY